jgi:hypothetical protein
MEAYQERGERGEGKAGDKNALKVNAASRHESPADGIEHRFCRLIRWITVEIVGIIY